MTPAGRAAAAALLVELEATHNLKKKKTTTLKHFLAQILIKERSHQQTFNLPDEK